eukprot:TRINITY_DN9416_c0_g1_i1.p1 TRINITY_DN9416_c0_g1~~TRINITY_DN9416_c0_g1_i1.p1  ORF type:complete len:343 (-),score=44.89 TRINITY_DN9416_c0_g1_i1:14-1042(-)
MKLHVFRLYRSLQRKQTPKTKIKYSPFILNRGFYSHVITDKKRKKLAETLVERSPPSIKPYLQLTRVDKPIGTWLLFWPCTWSIALASGPGALPSLSLLALFGLGSVVMRSAGCIVNDLWDRKIDARVARTRNRPLANSTLNTKQAITFLAANLSLGLGILLQLNNYCIGLGFLVMPLVLLYPGAKRVSYWPQFVLGCTFNWGILMGYAAVKGAIDWPIVLPLYLGSICWTIVYDTIYAHQDKEDDKIVGIKSTALRFGNNTKKWLSGFAGGTITGIAISGFMAGLSWPFYVGLLGAAVHLGWQISTVEIDNPMDCMRKFVSNTTFGAIVFASFVLGNCYVS